MGRTLLFICENPFQTMVAIVMKNQMFKEDVADLIITDRSSGGEKRIEILRESGLFREVLYVQTKRCHENMARREYHLNQARCIFKGCDGDFLQSLECDYDDIFALEINCFINTIISKTSDNGKLPQVHLTDEGYACYTKDYEAKLFGFHKGREFFYKLQEMLSKKKNAKSLVLDMYLFYPELCLWKPPFPIKKIEKPDLEKNAQLKKLLNKVFSYEESANEYDEQIIFFENCTYQDKNNNKDEALVLEIAGVVGKENMMVKLHPRTMHNRFETHGIKTNAVQGLPWEIVAMNMGDDAKKVFLTVSSGAVISYKFLFNKNYKSAMIYKCLQDSDYTLDGVGDEFLELFAKKFPENFLIPETMEELFAWLKS